MVQSALLDGSRRSNLLQIDSGKTTARILVFVHGSSYQHDGDLAWSTWQSHTNTQTYQLLALGCAEQRNKNLH